MHHSRLCAVLIDCKTCNVDEAAHFWAEALGRAVDSRHPGSHGNYRMLDTPPDEPIVQIQRVEHDSRVHIDIETDDIPAEVVRLEKLGAHVVDRLERWVVMQAPSGQRFCVVRVQRPGFPKNANRWEDGQTVPPDSTAGHDGMISAMQTIGWTVARIGAWAWALVTGVSGGGGLVGVQSVSTEVERLPALGATELEPVTAVGGGIKVAAVEDPFGNRLGIIENPNFRASEVR